MSSLDGDSIEDLYDWLDDIPFSIRKKKNLARDFADARLAAELIHYYCPALVSVSSYPAAMSTAKKEENWERFNRKVLSKLYLRLNKKDIADLAGAKLDVTESFLHNLAMALYKHCTVVRRKGLISYLKKIGLDEKDY